MSDPLARPCWRGRTNVDAITVAAIEAAEKIAGHLFTITQGSYQGGAGDPLSAGTHDLGGVVDIRWNDKTGPLDVLALRRVGFAAWHRSPDQGPWPDHIHAVLVGHPKLAASAARQAEAYLNGRDGLARNGADDGPSVNPKPIFAWPPKTEPTTADRLEAEARDLQEIRKDVKRPKVKQRLTKIIRRVKKAQR